MKNIAYRLIHTAVIGLCLWASDASALATATTTPTYENFPAAGPIAPRQLMTHHSGLPSDYRRLSRSKR